MEVKQKLAAKPAIEGILNRSQIAPFNNWLRLSQADLQLHLHLDGSSLGAWFVNNNTYLCWYPPRPIGHPKSSKVMADVNIQEK